MESPHRSISPMSHVSLIQENEIQPQAIAVRMRRSHHPHQMPPWLREAVAERKRQLIASRELDGANKLTKEHFGISQSKFDSQNTIVSDWLDGLPERLIEGWETVLREEVDETFVKKKAHLSLQRKAHLRLEDNDREYEHGDGYGHESEEGLDSHSIVEIVDEDETKNQEPTIDPEDEFLEKVLLGRKRLMQAEISVKRLKMGLKRVTSGLCDDFGESADAQRTRDLLTAVDNTFEEVVRRRFSIATVKAIDPKEDHRIRLEGLRQRDPELMGRIYSSKEIQELKTMVTDILAMDDRSGEEEGITWFLGMLPRLLELREDMALAEGEADKDKAVQDEESFAYIEENDDLYSNRKAAPYIVKLEPVPIWDLYYFQYCWLQSIFRFRPTDSWQAFEISLDDEIDSEDWQLRIEQRIWLQEQFGLNLGTMIWPPFRQSGAIMSR